MHEICNKPKTMFSDEINHSHKKHEKKQMNTRKGKENKMKYYASAISKIKPKQYKT